MTIIDVLRGEITKGRTHRPLQLALLATTTLTLAYCLLDSGGAGSGEFLVPPEAAGVYAFANLAFFPVIIAVLITASEYTGGQITSSILAAPGRFKVLTAKTVLSTALIALVAVILALYVTFFYQRGLGDQSVFATGNSGTLFASLGRAILAWVAIGIISTCAAIAIRSQTIVMSVMIVMAFGGVPLMMLTTVFQYLPTNTAILMFIDKGQTTDWLTPPNLTATSAATITFVWCLLALVPTSIVFTRRDIGQRQAIGD